MKSHLINNRLIKIVELEVVGYQMLQGSKVGLFICTFVLTWGVIGI
jgi:hypothetical protein